MWAALIPILLQIFGPIIAEKFKECAEARAKRAAAKLPDPSTYESDKAAGLALLAQMEHDSIRPGRKKSIRKAREKLESSEATSLVAMGALSDVDVAYLKGFAEAAIEE
jgi:hypothetical protein